MNDPVREQEIRRFARVQAGPPHMRKLRRIAFVAVLSAIVAINGCGYINVGKWKGIEKTSPDEQYYLLQDVWLTAGSAAHPRTSFDHAVHETVNVAMIPANEKNHYVTKTKWIDPAGIEFRTLRQTHDAKKEGDKFQQRNKKGSTRIHMMPLYALYNHKQGLWKVEVYIDDKMARRLKFTVR